MSEGRENGEEMKILEVIDNYFPTVDGVVSVVHNYAVQLNRKAECTVLAPKYPNAPIAEDYELIACKSVSGGKYGVRLPLPFFDAKLREILKEREFDIIHCHSPVTLCAYIERYAKKRGIPVIFTVHTKYHEEINAHVKSRLLRKIAIGYIISNMRKADACWAVSEGAKKMLKEDYRVDTPCKVVPNGAELGEYNISDEEIAEVKEEYGIKDTDFVALTVGRLVAVKNFHMAIDAVKILADEGIPVRLIMVGSGDCEKELKKLAEGYGLKEEIIFTGWIKEKRKLAALYSAANLFLMPSTFDTSSLAVKDAYATALPVLAIKGSSPADGIEDGKNGFLSEADTVAFANRIKDIYKDTVKIAEIGKAGQKELYKSWEDITDEVLELYKETLNQIKQTK